MHIAGTVLGSRQIIGLVRRNFLHGRDAETGNRQIVFIRRFAPGAEQAVRQVLRNVQHPKSRRCYLAEYGSGNWPAESSGATGGALQGDQDHDLRIRHRRETEEARIVMMRINVGFQIIDLSSAGLAA
jgi:hypothetical protein